MMRRNGVVRCWGLVVLLIGCGGSAATVGDGGAAGGATGSAGHAAGGSGGVTSKLPVCPGVVAPQGTPCRASSDCPVFGLCGPTYEVSQCGGAPLPPPNECPGDAGCAGDELCVAAAPGACGIGGILGTKCVPRCTSTSCGAGLACDMASGFCQPVPCGAAFTCGTGKVCAPARAGADANGCAIARCDTDGFKCPDGWTCGAGQDLDPNGCSAVSCEGGAFKCPVNTDCKASSTSPHHCERRACTDDKSCDCGACIGGSCQDHLFVCSPPPAA